MFSLCDTNGKRMTPEEYGEYKELGTKAYYCYIDKAMCGFSDKPREYTDEECKQAKDNLDNWLKDHNLSLDEASSISVVQYGSCSPEEAFEVHASSLKKSKLKSFLNKTVVFNELAHHFESDFDPGQKAKLVKITPTEDDIVILTFDFTDFEEYNKQFALPLWTDELGDGKNTLKFHESVFYPKGEKLSEIYYCEKDCELPSEVYSEEVRGGLPFKLSITEPKVGQVWLRELDTEIPEALVIIEINKDQAICRSSFIVNSITIDISSIQIMEENQTMICVYPKQDRVKKMNNTIEVGKRYLLKNGGTATIKCNRSKDHNIDYNFPYVSTDAKGDPHRFIAYNENGSSNRSIDDFDIVGEC